MRDPFPSEAELARRANALYTPDRSALGQLPDAGATGMQAAARERLLQESADARRAVAAVRALEAATPAVPIPPRGQEPGSYYFLDAAATSGSASALEAARADFPALYQRVHGRPLVWLDNAATTQKPRAVMEAMTRYYERDNSNVHRAAHTLAARATDAYEGARASVARLLGAPSPDSVVFVRGTTEGINLLAATLGRQRVGPGDEIVLSTLEHHANLVPWQMLAHDVGARLRPVPVDDTGQVQLDRYADLLTDRTKVVAVSHVSNALGTVLPVEAMIALAHARGIPVVVDGAQAVAHLPVAAHKVGVASFVVDGVPTEQVGAALDRCGIAVRAGHHCAQPALRRFGLESTVRASLAFYNTEAEIHALGTAVRGLVPRAGAHGTGGLA